MNESKTQANKNVIAFDKYDLRGAYHWQECDPKSKDFNPPLVARYQVVVDALTQIQRKDRVLDIGCGDAYLIASIESQCAEAIGVDSEAVAVDLANQILAPLNHCKAVVGNCYELPFDDNSFDVVLLTDVIEHLKQPADCLAQIRRVLKDDGHLILTTPKFRPDRKWDERHEKEFTSDELRAILSDHFPRVEISFFWPLAWSNRYGTRFGWRACKYIARAGWNPFLRESRTNEEKFGQMKAVCHCSP